MPQKRRNVNYKKYNGANGYYNSTSVAYDIPPVYIPTPQDDIKKLREIEKRRQEIRKSRINHAYTVKTVLAMVVLISGCLSIMGAHAKISQQRISLRDYKQQLSELRNENAILSAEIAEQVDLDKVKYDAINRLGMSEPQAYQVVYIDVPKQSYTLEFDTSSPKVENGNVRDKISAFIKGIGK